MEQVCIRPFKFWHYHKLDLSGQPIGLPLTKPVAQILSQGMVRTFVVKRHPLAVVGVAPHPDGFGFMWMYNGNDASRFALPMVRLGRSMIEEAHGRWPLIRAGVLVENERGHHLMRLLGFERMEGPGSSAPAPTDPSRVFQFYERRKAETKH